MGFGIYVISYIIQALSMEISWKAGI